MFEENKFEENKFEENIFHKIDTDYVNTERLMKEFINLVSIDSVSFQERDMADYLINQLNLLGYEVIEDNAGEHYNSNAGNLYAFKKGNIEGKPILFSSHMDTVEPGINKKALIHSNGKITSDGTSVLGADDMAGIAAILEALHIIKENELNHRDIELFFPIGEEAYLKGSEVFDYTKIQASEAYVLDLCGKIGTAALKAPTLISFTLEIFGKASHAGFEPEAGINSIQIASYIVSQIKQGQIDFETTVNIGTIEGGIATNIVPDYCKIRGEIRSFHHEKALNQVDNLEKLSQKIILQNNATYKLEKSVECYAYETNEKSEVVQRFIKACRQLNYKVSLTKTFGGSDNNNLVRNGINGIVIACGMEQVHTCNEYTNIKELIKSTRLLLQLMECEE